MKFIKYLLLGVLFGITASQSEIISWFRIQEMFHFESFHMYGIIGSAVVLGILITQIIKRTHMRGSNGKEIQIADKQKSIPRYLLGGTLFGLGWALTGACPGPLFILVGNGYLSFLLPIAGALLGTFVYGLVRHKLPH